MAKLLPVNVGLPREVPWQGKTVRTAVWKFPVNDRLMARKLNIHGDGQGVRRFSQVVLPDWGVDDG